MFFPTVVILIIGIVIGIVVVRFHGGRSDTADFVRVVYWGAAIAVIGLVAGVIGPMYAGQKSPQAPLLGVLLTGPAGAVLGCILGVFHSINVIRGRGSQKSNQSLEPTTDDHEEQI